LKVIISNSKYAQRKYGQTQNDKHFTAMHVTIIFETTKLMVMLSRLSHIRILWNIYCTHVVFSSDDRDSLMLIRRRACRFHLGGCVGWRPWVQQKQKQQLSKGGA
jgi:hypothetical protein